MILPSHHSCLNVPYQNESRYNASCQCGRRLWSSIFAISASGSKCHWNPDGSKGIHPTRLNYCLTQCLSLVRKTARGGNPSMLTTKRQTTDPQQVVGANKSQTRDQQQATPPTAFSSPARHRRETDRLGNGLYYRNRYSSKCFRQFFLSRRSTILHPVVIGGSVLDAALATDFVMISNTSVRRVWRALGAAIMATVPGWFHPHRTLASQHRRSSRQDAR